MAGKFKIMGYDKGNDTYEQIEEARTKKEALLAAESVMNKYLHAEELQKKYENIVVKNAQGQIIEIFSAECVVNVICSVVFRCFELSHKVPSFLPGGQERWDAKGADGFRFHRPRA